MTADDAAIFRAALENPHNPEDQEAPSVKDPRKDDNLNSEEEEVETHLEEDHHHRREDQPRERYHRERPNVTPPLALVRLGHERAFTT
ncbi:hypothetical protein EDB92DRAFT_1949192 [Lactarius akahatsu]|uniref:Uncharacterized protein n=1 Tax=Lactarius akahatsu TaxID=416441 RepID=A0AAD4QB03_9AGAM|nr:hypothetical protein EDB92DRAFT_1949192 [Lactarius akahatsu]